MFALEQISYLLSGHGCVTKHPKTLRDQITRALVSIFLQKMMIGSLLIKSISPQVTLSSIKVLNHKKKNWNLNLRLMSINNVIVRFHQTLITISSYTSGSVICQQSKPLFGYLNIGPFFGPYKTHFWFLLEPSSKKYFNQ